MVYIIITLLFHRLRYLDNVDLEERAHREFFDCVLGTAYFHDDVMRSFWIAHRENGHPLAPMYILCNFKFNKLLYTSC